MSKLQQKITRIQRREGSGSFGFGAMHREQPRAMLLGAFASDAEGIAAMAQAGADVLIVRSKDAGKAVAKAAVKEIAAGAWVEQLDDATADALKEAGCDFVVSSLDGTAASAVSTERMGQVIIAEEAPDDTTLRALAPLGLDAIFVEHDAGSMTLRQQLALVRVASFSSTPLIVPVSADASVAELRVLRDSGSAVVIATEGTGADSVRELGERLRQVPAAQRSRNGREMALVPSLAARHDEEEDEPEEI